MRSPRGAARLPSLGKQQHRFCPLLEAMASGSRVVEFGCSMIGDYASETLGIAASTAEKMVRFARPLRERPLVRAAVRNIRAAQAVLLRASGEAEERASSASHQTVRALQAAVKGIASEEEKDKVATHACAILSGATRRPR